MQVLPVFRLDLKSRVDILGDEHIVEDDQISELSGPRPILKHSRCTATPRRDNDMWRVSRRKALALDYRDEARAATLKAVVDWFATVSGNGDYDAQLSNIHRWATDAQPADHSALGIGGFGLSGFQYLRMLFGANTTKPDIHIRRYVESCIGHSVSDVRALQLLEQASSTAGIRLVDLDTTIWERSARGLDHHRGF